MKKFFQLADTQFNTYLNNHDFPISTLDVNCLYLLIQDYKVEQMESKKSITSLWGLLIPESAKKHLIFINKQKSPERFPGDIHIAKKDLPNFFKQFFVYLGQAKAEEIVVDPFFSRIAVWVFHYQAYLAELQIPIPTELQRILFAHCQGVDLSSTPAKEAKIKQQAISTTEEKQVPIAETIKNLQSEDFYIFERTCSRLKKMNLSEAEICLVIDSLLTRLQMSSKHIHLISKTIAELTMIPPQKTIAVLEALFGGLIAGHFSSMPIENLNLIAYDRITAEFLSSKLLTEDRYVRSAAEALLKKIETSAMETSVSKPLDSKTTGQQISTSPIETQLDRIKHASDWLTLHRECFALINQQNLLTLTQGIELIDLLLKQASSTHLLLKRTACLLLCKIAIPPSKTAAVLEVLLVAVTDFKRRIFHQDLFEEFFKALAMIRISPTSVIDIDNLLEKLDPTQSIGGVVCDILKKLHLNPIDKTKVLKHLFNLADHPIMIGNIAKIEEAIISICTSGDISPDMIDFLLEGLKHAKDGLGFSESTLICTALRAIVIPPDDQLRVFKALLDKTIEKGPLTYGCVAAIIETLGHHAIPQAYQKTMQQYFLSLLKHYLKQYQGADKTDSSFLLTLPLIKAYQKHYGIFPDNIIEQLIASISPKTVDKFAAILPQVQIPEEYTKALWSALVTAAQRKGFVSDFQREELISLFKQLLNQFPSTKLICSLSIFIRNFINQNGFSGLWRSSLLTMTDEVLIEKQTLYEVDFILLDVIKDMVISYNKESVDAMDGLIQQLAKEEAQAIAEAKKDEEKAKPPSPTVSLVTSAPSAHLWASTEPPLLSPSPAGSIADEKSKTRIRELIIAEIGDLLGDKAVQKNINYDQYQKQAQLYFATDDIDHSVLVQFRDQLATIVRVSTTAVSFSSMS